MNALIERTSKETKQLILISVTAVVCIFSICSGYFSLITKENLPTYLFEEPNTALPLTFAVSSDYDTPAKDQGKLFTSWIFAFIARLEGEYKKQGKQKKLLADDKFMGLSEQFFMTSLKRMCTDYPERSKYCTFPNSPFSTVDQSGIIMPELLKKFPELKKAAAPLSICPYNGSVMHEFQCPVYSDNTLKNNPIQFNIKNITWATSIGDIKKLLLEKNRPLVLTMPEPYIRMYNDCQDEQYAKTSDCLNKQVLCPPFYQSAYCNLELYPAYKYHGEYYVPQYSEMLDISNPISGLIVGYSDSYISQSGYLQASEAKTSKGGFIVKLSNGLDTGFPISHYTGNLSTDDSFAYCHNEHSPSFWLGSSIKCMESGGSLSICDGDILECIDPTMCNENATYTLQRTSEDDLRTFVYTDGISYTIPLYQQVGDDLKTIKVRGIPISSLSSFFKKKHSTLSDNIHCGYAFIPYDVLEGVSSKNGGSLNSVIAIDYDIDFTKSSYHKYMASGSIKTSASSSMRASLQRPATTLS